MRKMDEMDRRIQLHAEEFGYRTLMLALCVWTLSNSYQVLVNGAKHEPLPALLLCLAACVQSFSQIAMKQKMVAGDEEYKEPNKLVRMIIGAVVIAAVGLWAGSYFFYFFLRA